MTDDNLFIFNKYINQHNLILPYEDVMDILKGILNDSDNKISVKDETKETSTYDYPIVHYKVGTGDKHVVVIGGTHGNEIISVNFVLQLLYKITNKLDEFINFDDKRFTIHFFPLQNPEGYIITTTAIQTRISQNTPLEEMIKLSFEYYSLFKEDDIFSKSNRADKNIKKHQLFMNVENLKIDRHKVLLNHAVSLIEKNNFPIGSLISWRANGNGVELNSNTSYKKRKGLDKNKIVYGGFRYNNLSLVLGPLGTTSISQEEFIMEKENQIILDLINFLHSNNLFYGAINYHSTGGTIFYRPYKNAPNELIDLETFNKINKNNLELAKIYSKISGYPINYQMPYGSFDDYLRIKYPNILLIELSKMGGNPLGPYGDLDNYKRVITDNLKAFSELIKVLKR